MKISKFVILFGLLLFPTILFSQRWKLSRSEYMFGIGISNYFGDMGGAMEADAPAYKDIDIAYTRPVLQGGYRYKVYERVAVKGELLYARFYGSDVSSQNEGRNNSFASNMIEVNGHIEYHISEEKTVVSYKSMSLRGKLRKFNAGLNFYVFAGVGGAYFKPVAKDDLITDTRFNDNKNIALVVPFGFGLKYPLSTKSSIGLEFGRRFITTDFIDGFSPDPSEHRDVYYFTVINVSYKIKRKNNRRPEYRF